MDISKIARRILSSKPTKNFFQTKKDGSWKTTQEWRELVWFPENARPSDIDFFDSLIELLPIPVDGDPIDGVDRIRKWLYKAKIDGLVTQSDIHQISWNSMCNA